MPLPALVANAALFAAGYYGRRQLISAAARVSTRRLAATAGIDGGIAAVAAGNAIAFVAPEAIIDEVLQDEVANYTGGIPATDERRFGGYRGGIPAPDERAFGGYDGGISGFDGGIPPPDERAFDGYDGGIAGRVFDFPSNDDDTPPSCRELRRMWQAGRL